MAKHPRERDLRRLSGRDVGKKKQEREEEEEEAQNMHNSKEAGQRLVNVWELAD